MSESKNTISRKISVVTELKNNKLPRKQKLKLRTAKISSVAKNGLSVENLRSAGHKITVHHYRAYYSDDVDRIIYLPSHTKYLDDPLLHLEATGGYTRIAITPSVTPDSPLVDFAIQDDEDGPLFYYSNPTHYTSHCSSEDLYCYKLGVTKALDRISFSVAKALLNGPLTLPIE